MTTHQINTTSQQNKIAQLEAALAQVVANVSRRGFFGSASVVLKVQDGRIQHIRASIEQMMK